MGLLTGYNEYKSWNPNANIFDFMQHNLTAQQIHANYVRNNPQENALNNASAKEFYDWYKNKRNDLKNESGLSLTLPSEAVESGAESVSNILPYSGSYGYGSGSGAGFRGVSGDMQAYLDLINYVTDKNNAYSAAQAQKQMDFQERMARNAHTYEMEDLKNAGLNPVLAAGAGSGASTPSGAMGQTDTSNSSAAAQLAMEAVSSLGSSAVALASGYNSRSSDSFKNNLLNAAQKYFIPTLVRGAASAIAKGLF